MDRTWGAGRPTSYVLLAAIALAAYPHLHLHASRAELLRRLGRGAEAAVAYERALERTGNASERRFLKQRLDTISSDPRLGR